MIERQGGLVLHGLNREIAAYVTHARQLEQRVEQETFIGREVGNNDLQQKVGLSRYEMAGHDFRQGANRFPERRCRLVVVTLDLDPDKDGQAKAKAGPTEARMIAADHAGLFQKANTPQAWRRR